MGYSSQQYRKDVKARPWKINPVWRGIGCFLILLIPIMAWISADIFMNSGQKIIRSPEMDKPVTVKYIHVLPIDKVIQDFNQYTIDNNLVQGQFVFTIIFIVAGYGILAFIYALLYSLAGPPRYGPFDVPPEMMRR